jgi:C4-dicarboxylate-specific signal transduction histidine kinase
LDTVTDIDISISVLYVTLVMIVLRTGTIRDVRIAGIGCCLLTIVSYWLVPGLNFSHFDKAAFINAFISLFAITSVTYLSIKLARADASARRARDQVARTMLNVSVNELATSVVHEINQPLGAISANGGAAKHWLDEEPANLAEASAAIEAVLLNARRANGVISGLRRVAQLSLSNQKPFDLAELIEETVELLRHEIEDRQVSVEMQISQTTIQIDGDRSLLQQVLVNVISNAIEAMDRADITNRSLIIDVRVSTETVLIDIGDTGPGIAVDNIDDIFDPFYTTKAGGLGIGLAISRSIAAVHGGSLIASPNKPCGTVVSVELPKMQRALIND